MQKLDGFNWIEKTLIWLFRSLQLLLGVAMFGLFAMLFAGVVGRYFEWSLYWVEEMVLQFIVYITMVGCCTACRRSMHPKLVIIYDRFKGNKLFLYECILRLAVFALMFVFAYYGYKYARTQRFMRTSALGMSYFWPFFGIPFGAGITFLALGLDTLDIALYRRSWLMNINVPEYDDGAGRSE